MNPLTQCKTTILIAGVLTCFALAPVARAVFPPPDGGYPGGNTAEGQAALLSLTTGTFNTAVGFLSLRSNATGNYNTAVGAGTLLANTSAANTATGAGALLSNTSGGSNTANGAFALLSNTTGHENTANGAAALFSNSEGSANNAVGSQALSSNITGSGNNAFGYVALQNNTSGHRNAAFGGGALYDLTTGNDNTALGSNAGLGLTTGDHNVCIGADVFGVAGESNTIRIGNPDIAIGCYIAGVFGATVFNSAAVSIDPNGKLGTITSSIRFKDDIKPTEQASEALFALKPVTFRYKKEIEPTGKSHFGLVAEDVEKVNPDLVVRDKEGKPYSVRYDQVNAMLLNEFLKEHRKNSVQEATIGELKATVAKQGATIAQQQEQMDALTAGLRVVSSQIEMSKVAADVVRNNQ